VRAPHTWAKDWGQLGQWWPPPPPGIPCGKGAEQRRRAHARDGHDGRPGGRQGARQELPHPGGSVGVWACHGSCSRLAKSVFFCCMIRNVRRTCGHFQQGIRWLGLATYGSGRPSSCCLCGRS